MAEEGIVVVPPPNPSDIPRLLAPFTAEAPPPSLREAAMCSVWEDLAPFLL